jgi:hypothetical protein
MECGISHLLIKGGQQFFQGEQDFPLGEGRVETLRITKKGLQKIL